jgi:hypothetical protein
MCDASGSCDFNYERNSCSECDSDFVQTSTGCTDLTPNSVDPASGEEALGGIFIYPNELDYTLPDFKFYDCSNITLPSSSEDPGDQVPTPKATFTVTKDTEKINYGLRAFWVIVGIVILVIGVVVFVFWKCSGKNNWAE